MYRTQHLHHYILEIATIFCGVMDSAIYLDTHPTDQKKKKRYFRYIQSISLLINQIKLQSTFTISLQPPNTFPLPLPNHTMISPLSLGVKKGGKKVAVVTSKSTYCPGARLMSCCRSSSRREKFFCTGSLPLRCSRDRHSAEGREVTALAGQWKDSKQLP